MNKWLQVPKRIVILCLVILVAAGSVFQANSSYAWFLFGSKTEEDLKAGLVSFLPTDNADQTYGSFIENTSQDKDGSYVYPGRQLLAEKKDESLDVLRLLNLSTISTNVRARVEAVIVTDYGMETQSKQQAVCQKKRDGSGYWMGLMTGLDNKKFIPLLDLKFERAGSSYRWELVTDPVRAAACEWELVPTPEGTLGMGVPIPPDPKRGQEYETLTSVAIVSELRNTQEEELFTDVYSNKHLLLTVTYLAKQFDELEWNVFHVQDVVL